MSHSGGPTNRSPGVKADVDELVYIRQVDNRRGPAYSIQVAGKNMPYHLEGHERVFRDRIKRMVGWSRYVTAVVNSLGRPMEKIQATYLSSVIELTSIEQGLDPCSSRFLMLSTSPNVAPRRSSSPLMDKGPVCHRAQSTQHWWHSIVANPVDS